ncbi:hypothetical protein T484DRAFT_1756598 [Baffinella frigidus]|nr:hypothetical protein T484DRAFT_1756598 [Cryptophyta sp. CCMP2293]
MEVYAALLWLQMKQLTYDLHELVDGLPSHNTCLISLWVLFLTIISIAVPMLLEYLKQTRFTLAICIAYTIYTKDTNNKLHTELLDTKEELSETYRELQDTITMLTEVESAAAKMVEKAITDDYEAMMSIIDTHTGYMAWRKPDRCLAIISQISDLYSELSSTMYDFETTIAGMVQAHPTIVEELQEIKLYTEKLKSEITSLKERVKEQKHQYEFALKHQIGFQRDAMDNIGKLEEKLTKQKLMEQETHKTMEKKLADKDIVIGFLMTRKTPYSLIFICIVMGMVLGVFHELATNVTAYIGYQIIIATLYFVRQVILALVYVLQICLEEVSDF